MSQPTMPHDVAPSNPADPLQQLQWTAEQAITDIHFLDQKAGALSGALTVVLGALAAVSQSDHSEPAGYLLAASAVALSISLLAALDVMRPRGGDIARATTDAGALVWLDVDARKAVADPATGRKHVFKDAIVVLRDWGRDFSGTRRASAAVQSAPASRADALPELPVLVRAYGELLDNHAENVRRKTVPLRLAFFAAQVGVLLAVAVPFAEWMFAHEQPGSGRPGSGVLASPVAPRVTPPATRAQTPDGKKAETDAASDVPTPP